MISSWLTASVAPPDSSRAHRTGPRCRCADADGRRDGPRIGDGHAAHDRGSALGLGAVEAGLRPRDARVVGLGEAAPVRGDVAGVADRDEERVGCVAERLADLERRGLLTLDAVGVDAVHERRLARLAELAHDRERRIERAAYRDDARTEGDGLHELPD